MQRLEAEAGVTHEARLTNLAEVTARVFSSRQRFSVGQCTEVPSDPTFVSVDERMPIRRRHRGGRIAINGWLSGLLDVPWNLPSYEGRRRMGVDGTDATRAVQWLMATGGRGDRWRQSSACVTSIG